MKSNVKLYFICGVPGAGKSSIASYIANKFPDRFYYADISKSDDFRKIPMARIVVESYKRNGLSRNLITEAVLGTIDSRDKFLDHIANKLNISLKDIKIIYLKHNNPEVLSTRRNRTTDAYHELIRNYEEGSNTYNFVSYIVDPAKACDISSNEIIHHYMF